MQDSAGGQELREGKGREGLEEIDLSNFDS